MLGGTRGGGGGGGGGGGEAVRKGGKQLDVKSCQRARTPRRGEGRGGRGGGGGVTEEGGKTEGKVEREGGGVT